MIYALFLFLPNDDVDLMYKNSCMFWFWSTLESRHAIVVIFYVKKKIDLAFILAKEDWVVTSPCLTDPVAPVSEINEADTTWTTKERDFESRKMSYALEHRKWVTANKKCLTVIKNMIEPAIVGSIPECDTVIEYLDRIKSQFTSFSNKYAT